MIPKLVAFWLGNPSVSVPHNGERTRPGDAWLKWKRAIHLIECNIFPIKFIRDTRVTSCCWLCYVYKNLGISIILFLKLQDTIWIVYGWTQMESGLFSWSVRDTRIFKEFLNISFKNFYWYFRPLKRLWPCRAICLGKALLLLWSTIIMCMNSSIIESNS